MFAWTLNQYSGNKPLPPCDGVRKLWTVSSIKAGVLKVWPVGQIRPFKEFHLALKMLITVERSICFNTNEQLFWSANNIHLYHLCRMQTPQQFYQKILFKVTRVGLGLALFYSGTHWFFVHQVWVWTFGSYSILTSVCEDIFYFNFQIKLVSKCALKTITDYITDWLLSTLLTWLNVFYFQLPFFSRKNINPYTRV